MKTVDKLVVLCAAVVLCALGGDADTQAQETTGTIAGRVTDAKTKQPLAYANVIVLGTNLGAMTKADGSYEIKNIQTGWWCIKAMMMGFESHTTHSVEVKAGVTTELSFELDGTIVMRTQEIVVSAEKKKIRATTSGARAAGSEKKPAAQPQPEAEKADAEALKPGGIMRRSELHVRGGRSGKARVRIDGVPVDDPLAAGEPSGSVDDAPPVCAPEAFDGNAPQTSAPRGSVDDAPQARTPRVSYGDALSAAAHRVQPRAYQPVPQMCRANRHSCKTFGFPWPRFNTESYDVIYENEFLDALDNPYSTFSVDVDQASYSNVRRFLRGGFLPPPGAVRIEELVNYFSYDYPEPDGPAPFSITANVAGCPWNTDHRLARIGLQGERVDLEKAPRNNLVFLIDVSGSMRPANKLPLLKGAFLDLVGELRAKDRVAIVVYASSAGVHMESTSGKDKDKIREHIGGLYAGGSTAGGDGIRLAYEVAEKNFIEGGNNRVILATDGDFNTGPSSDSYMVSLIEEKRKSGVFLTVLGFGEANLKDAKLEKIADHGNGHYAYIDDAFEARRVLVNELGGTLYAIAKDVKIQVEFNPAKVKSYRLIGYENRLLKKEDFANDRKDAGEIGAGHRVTALYEVVPAEASVHANTQRRTAYTTTSVDPGAFDTAEILTVRFRYKAPDRDKSELIVQTLADDDGNFEDASEDFRFAAAVAEFGMLLRDSQFKGESSYEHVLRTAKKSTGEDEGGYRHEFVRLVEMCQEILDR